jgi:hypothetical protein
MNRKVRQEMKRREFFKKAGIGSAAFVSLAGPRQARGDDTPNRLKIMEIDVVNWTRYLYDVADYSKLATISNATTPIQPRNFGTFLGVADIVAVDGKPAKGTWTARATIINMTPNPRPGDAVADTVRGRMVDFSLEILEANGTPVGTIMASGLTAGPPPPEAPIEQMGDNLAITGGTGAFLGARGQMGFAAVLIPPRAASVTEDPSLRRVHGGGALRFAVQLLVG